ncbi:MAG: TPMT family class I SAM-dependent methyltransferase [Burkholderiaceae bacterium]|nr:TPMT family class I SAM-dependent methyltransferase [Burkholderiaceae bacterium]
MSRDPAPPAAGSGRADATATAPASPAGPTADFWQQRFASGRTPWDRGEVNPALEPLIARGAFPAGALVLVPGCGAGHEVARLAAAGCRVLAVDYAPGAVALTRERLVHEGLRAQVIEADLLEWTPPAPLDAIWDQACLCALHPDRWIAYATRLAHWTSPGGLLVLLAVQAEREGRRQGFIEGPPYHCDANAMRALFPSTAWKWPKPPYESRAHRSGFAELQLLLTRAG